MFEDIKKKIDNAVLFCMEDMVDETVEMLIDESPVWTGNFVKSMKAEETAKSYPRSQFMGSPPYPPKAPSPDAIKMAEKSRLKQQAKDIIKKTGKVAINNSAKHAMFVEHLGWEMPGTTDSVAGVRHAARMPFAKTKESIGLRKKLILNGAKLRAFGK